jgi:hypothetical protein
VLATSLVLWLVLLLANVLELSLVLADLLELEKQELLNYQG